jgi:hypothetical protein
MFIFQPPIRVNLLVRYYRWHVSNQEVYQVEQRLDSEEEESYQAQENPKSLERSGK